jgi:hypothetical protein
MPTALASSKTTAFEVLRDGLVVPVPVLRLLWELENAGYRLRITEDGSLQLAPFSKLSSAQLGELRRWKRHLIALVQYCERDHCGHLRGCSGK